MDRPNTTRILFRGSHFGLEDARRVFARCGLNASRNKHRVTVHLPGGADWVWIELDRGRQVRRRAAALAQAADPSWAWDLAGCESEFVVTCDHYNAARLRELLDARDEVVKSLQAATQGFRYEVRYEGYDPEVGPRIIPPAGWSG